MTICIGAICQKKYVVVATDRMITSRMPNIEFEQASITKAIEIIPTCMAATAGSAIALNPILHGAKTEITQGSVKDISAIAECLRKYYVKQRNQKLTETVFSSAGLTLQDFYKINQALQPQLAALLFQNMQRYNYELWMVIAGVDDTGAHLWHLENPGNKECLDNLGFHAVGSGQHHAISTFIANEFDPNIDLSHGLAIAFEGKKRSEKATGVGKLTDIAIIDDKGNKRLSETEIAKLEKIYKAKIDREKNTIKSLDKKIRELDFLSEYQ